MTALAPTHDHWSGWRFYSIEQLVQGLEEYASFQGVPKVHRYGAPPGDGNPADAAHECVMRQNRAIDKAMCRLRHVNPRLHRLIDAYYRGGRCYEAAGWKQALERAGFPSATRTGHQSDFMRKTFEVLLDEAHAALFYMHNVRPRRTT